MILPETGLGKDGGERLFSGRKRPVEAVQEPEEPGGDVAIALLSLLQNVVVFLLQNLHFVGHTVEALDGVFATGQEHIRDGSGDTAVAIVEGVDGDEPQVGDAGFEDGVCAIIGVYPVDEAVHLLRHALRLWSLVVDLFVTHRPGDYLHFAAAVFCYFYGIEAAAA